MGKFAFGDWLRYPRVQRHVGRRIIDVAWKYVDVDVRIEVGQELLVQLAGLSRQAPATAIFVHGHQYGSKTLRGGQYCFRTSAI